MERGEDGDEEKICRICHSPGDSENPLQYPCACSGSMKFVHPKCLLHWMKQQITFQCEVCKHKFSVYRVYAKNTPTRLPLREFVCGIAMKACHVLHFCLRICFSGFHQFIMEPLFAFWTWRLYLVCGGSVSVARELVHRHMSLSTIMMDWLYGIRYILVWRLIVSAVSHHLAYLIGFLRGFLRGLEDAEAGVHVAVAPAPANNMNHNVDEDGEDAGERQAIVGVTNSDSVTLWLRLWAAFLRFVPTLMIILRAIKLDVPLQKTCIQLHLVINFGLIFVPFLLGRFLLHGLSWCFSAAFSVFMLITKLAFYITDGLLSSAIEVVAETLTANRNGPGESVGKPLLVNRSSGLYDIIALATGYMAIVSLVIVFLVCVCVGTPIRTVASKILRKFLTTYQFFLTISLGVLPLAYGWWLDVCTITVLGKSISDRVDFFSEFPFLSSSMHWMVGIIYMFQIHMFSSQVQRVLRKEIQCFLQDLADPIYIILRVLVDDVQVQASQFLFIVAVNGIFIVFLVCLPILLAMRSAPTIFPLHISVSDPFTEIPAVMLLLQICLPYAIELWETVEALLHQWVTVVCHVVGLNGFLRSRSNGGKDNVNVERRQDRLHDDLISAQDPNKSIFTSQNFDGVENHSSDSVANVYTFVLRVVLLVVLAWITFLLFSSSLIIVSIPLGRVLCSSISNLPILHGIKCNDLHAFFIGNLSIWIFITGAKYSIEHFKARKTHLWFNDISKKSCSIVKNYALLSLWIIVIPVLIGRLFELSFMVLIRALVVEAPVLLLCQDWAVGVFFFELWKMLVLLNHKIVLVDESWRIKFERVRDNDFLKLPGNWILQEILVPILVNLLSSLCLPYVFARWIVPSLGFSQTVNSTVYQFAWVAYVTIIILFSCAKRFPLWLANLHNSVRDDRYSGLGLQNFGEASLHCQIEIDELVRWLSESQGR
ncbi:hypothetical protein MKW94_009637 [Papaver nudicaule]|uniref:RING-type E3 ubiquitin transferase n=1 Tax=Papaver nudicaule TaxID=74823 RepID=A0AA41S0R3_PAPNU|nr:hypothetical protein [Papaver nudicaule]